MPSSVSGLNLIVICVVDLMFVLVNIMYEKFWNRGVWIMMSTVRKQQRAYYTSSRLRKYEVREHLNRSKRRGGGAIVTKIIKLNLPKD